MYDRGVRVRRLGGAAAVAVAGLLAGAACGSSGYRYVSNSKTSAYLKVPDGWTEFEEDQLVEAQANAGGADLVNPLDSASLLAEKMGGEGLINPPILWRLSFDSDTQPALEHV